MSTFDNQKSKIDNEFEPLVAQPLTPPSPPATVINWLERVAPHLSTQEHLRTLPPVNAGEALAKGVRRADFLDVDEIAARERDLQETIDLELPEITRLRMEAAAEAQTLVGEALVQAQSIEQEARERGFEAGYERGYADGH